MTELDENGFKIRTIRKTMKNGVKYVYRRKMRYNPKKGFEEVVESELIGKILPGEEEISLSSRPLVMSTVYSRREPRALSAA